MKKNRNLLILPPLLFVLTVPRSSQYALRDIRAIRRALSDSKPPTLMRA